MLRGSHCSFKTGALLLVAEEGHLQAVVEEKNEPLMVRVLEARLMGSLQMKARYQVGWKQEENRWYGVHLAKRLQTPQFVGEIPSTTDWKRTTILKVKDQWQLYEMCENLLGLDNLEEIIDAVEENTLVLTILTAEDLSTEEMGFEVDTGLDLQPKMDDALALREHEIPVEEPQHAMDEAAADAIPAVAEGADGGGAGEQEGRLVLEAGLPDHVVVNDIQLTPTSRLRELRAACHFFGN